MAKNNKTPKAPDLVDTSLKSIVLTSLATALPSVKALALHNQVVVAAPPPAAKSGNQLRTSVVIPAQKLKVLGLNPKAPLEGRGNRTVQVAAQQPGPTPPIDPNTLYAHPDVGGKFTICVLFYGGEEYFELHKKCLSSIVTTVPPERMDLRVGSNELNPRSLAMLDELVKRGVIRKHYRHETNDKKYPVMREMFFDPDCPITTKWVIWFDDDSIADRTPQWLGFLAQTIMQNHKPMNAHMIGCKYIWTLQKGQREWYESRPWFKGKAWRGKNGKPTQGGNTIHFCSGGFWALTHEAIVACDIPDPGLNHNGGDYTIGEQLYQGGYEIKNFNSQKKIIHTSSVPRRGLTTPHPGTPGYYVAGS
jgi:hypothetical protein